MELARKVAKIMKTSLIDAEIQVARDIGFRFHPTRGSMSLGRSAGGDYLLMQSFSPKRRLKKI